MRGLLNVDNKAPSRIIMFPFTPYSLFQKKKKNQKPKRGLTPLIPIHVFPLEVMGRSLSPK
jgi:hypothetical protein